MISVVIPAFNEESRIVATVRAALAAGDRLRLSQGIDCEVLVVDNASEDRTAARVRSEANDPRVRLVRCDRRGAARARNVGAGAARGGILAFVDADTLVAEDSLERIALHCSESSDVQAGIARLLPLDGDWRAAAWWSFWGAVRYLPLARAKAMPAFMFCRREVFDRLGPFDESVAIGEEWPILAGAYRERRASLVYDRRLRARTSSRRMSLQRWGYARTFCKYVWAILHVSGRNGYSDRIR